LSAIGIADHDSVEGIVPALEEGKRLDIEVVPSIEVSSEPCRDNLPELHFLGYWIVENTELLAHIRFLKKRVLSGPRDNRKTRQTGCYS